MRRARSTMAAGLLGISLLGAVPPATAQDPTTTTTTVEAFTAAGAEPLVESEVLEGDVWELSYESLGYAPTLVPELYSGTIELDVPDVDGLGVARLRGVIVATAVETGGALVTVYADGLPIAEAAISPGSAETVDLDIPTGTTTVTFASSSLASDLVECPARTAPIELREPSLAYQGTPAPPQDLESFLPAAMHGLTIAIDERSDEVDQAVIDLAAALAHLYPDRFTIDVVATDPDRGPQATIDPFRRTVWLTSEGTGRALVVPSGDFSVARLDVADLADLLPPPSDPIGIDESGQMTLTPHLSPFDVDEGAGHVELSIVASQASLGGPHHELTVRAGGRVTHLAGGLPDATSVALWAGDRLLSTAPVDEVGRFDLEHAVDDGLLVRDTVFLVTVDAPRLDEDYCDGGPPLRLELDEGSWLAATPGQPLDPGFLRYPQTLLPDHQLFVGGALDDLEAAAGLIALLQNTSANPLSAAVGSEAQSLKTAIIMVGESDELIERLDLTLPGPADFPGAIDEIGLDAVLVATEHDGQDVLVLDNHERGAQARLIHTLREKGFAELSGHAVGLVGDSLVKARGNSTTDRALLPTLGDQPDTGGGPSTTGQLFMYGLLGAAAVMGLALALGPIRQLMKR